MSCGRILNVLVVCSWWTFAGCITAPDVVLVEDKTALEKQAAGEYQALEHRLNASVLKGGPVAFSAAKQKQEGGVARDSAMTELTRLYTEMNGEQETVDQLLVARCIGESLTGLLVLTPDACTEDTNPDEVNGLVGRVNRARQQLWRDVVVKNTAHDESKVIQTWRVRHLQRLVCEGWMETSTGWESRQCEEL